MIRLSALHWPIAVVAVAAPAQAQRAGLWETTVIAADGTTVATDRSCMPVDAVSSALARLPPNCVGGRNARTAAGLVAEAVCRQGASGVTLTLRRELSGDLQTRFRIVTTNHVDGPDVGSRTVQRSTGEARYLGACPGQVNTSDDSNYTTPVRAGAVALWLVQLALFLGGVWAMIAVPRYLVRRFAPKTYPGAVVDNIVVGADGSAAIPVLATFTGVRGLRWWYAIAYNNAKPLLCIKRDGIDYRVIRRSHRGFSAIESVDVRQAPGTVNLDFTFRGELLTFAANLGAMPLAAHVLSLLPAHIPLSARAKEILTAMSIKGVATN